MRFCLSCSSENSEHSATWLFALERDSTLSSHSKQSFWFQIFHRIRKNKMANGKTKRVGHFHVGPLVLRGLKVAARITFWGANVAGAACTSLVDGCTGIRASFRFSVVHSPHRRPRRFCFFPHAPHFSKGHNRSVAHVCQAAAGRAVSRHGVRSSHKRCSHRALQIIKQPQGDHRIKQHHHVLHSCFQPRHWLR